MTKFKKYWCSLKKKAHNGEGWKMCSRLIEVFNSNSAEFHLILDSCWEEEEKEEVVVNSGSSVNNDIFADLERFLGGDSLGREEGNEGAQLVVQKLMNNVMSLACFEWSLGTVRLILNKHCLVLLYLLLSSMDYHWVTIHPIWSLRCRQYWTSPIPVEKHTPPVY